VQEHSFIYFSAEKRYSLRGEKAGVMVLDDRESFDSYIEEKRGDLSTAIHVLWNQRDEQVWKKDPYFYTRLGELADKVGQPMFALDVLGEGLRHRQKYLRQGDLRQEDLRLTQLFCLSKIKCGYLIDARDMLSRLVKQGNQDEETLGILGRVYKEMWLNSSGGAPDHPSLKRSRNLYLKAFINTHGNYSGINAASLSLIMGDTATAHKMARKVIGICSESLKQEANKRDYWIIATLGEAFILLGKQEQAQKYYGIARRIAGKNYSSIASTRRQLKLLSRYTEVDDSVLATLEIPPVLAFSGHMLDAPTRKKPRFPVGSVEPVKQQIEAVLAKLEAGISYSSAACGSDVLFLECMQARGGETNVILPFDREDFYDTSVTFAGEQWIRRVDRVLDRASRVYHANQGHYGGDDLLFSYANTMIMGKAILRSRLLETEAHLIAVWDGNRNGATGGTSDFVAIWESLGIPVTAVSSTTGEIFLSREGSPAIEGARRSVPTRKLRARRSRKAFRKRSGEVGREIVAILFADLVGFSKLKEEQYPSYIEGFLGTLARRLEGSPFVPIYKNIWGDAICFVFEDLLSAAEYAMELRDMVRETEWEQLGLPRNLSIRIGLHVGPVYYAQEPLLKRLNFFGSHVNQAARIEPITTAGNVYASEQFAAFLLANQYNPLECKYVGEIKLPKEFGSYPIYHIKRKTDIE
jgi:class 3 adenylate cyclase/tetratricopeptide (TPR) repeat protein